MLKDKKVFLIITMDCERIAKYSPIGGGPETWELSERSILGLADILNKRHIKGGFYSTPETAKKHSNLFLELEKKEFELGLQFHVDSFRDLRYKKPLGHYGYKEQKRLLAMARQDWEDVLGRKLKTFRSGFFSANDYTFPILYELGVRQTSCSSPGRYRPEYGALWYGTYPYAHHVSTKSRLICGGLDIYEVPATVHPTRRIGKKQDTSIDLRPDWEGWIFTRRDYINTIRDCLDDMIKREQPIKTIVAITHNHIDYLDNKNKFRKTLEFIIEQIFTLSEKKGLKVTPATLEDIHREADKIGAF